MKQTCRKSWAGNLLIDQMRIAKLKSAYNSPIIGPRVLQCETNL